MSTPTRRTISLAIAMAAGLASAQLSAQQSNFQLEEIVVTAQKKAESLQDTPLSVEAYGEMALEAKQIANLSDLTNLSPSLQGAEFPTTTSNVSLFVRGFGNADSQTLTIDNPVGIYIDGVYVARTSGATLDVLDLERVEILRGPQGTIFGRNSSAGAVNFITKRPEDEFKGKVKVGAGNFGSWNSGVTVDIPISSTFRTKLSYNASGKDGWAENTGANAVAGQPSEDYYQKKEQGFRLAATWDITNNLTLDYSYDHTDIDSTPPYLQLGDDGRKEETTHLFLGGAAYRYVLPESNNTQWGHNLTATWNVNDSVTLKSITGYREMEEYAAANWPDTLFYATALDWSTEAFSQEFQLLGQTDRLDYILGLYYFEEQGDKTEEQMTNAVSLAFDPMAEPLASTSLLLGGNNLGATIFDTDLKSRAVFAQATYTPDILDSRLSLTGGLRYTEDEREATRGVVATNPSISFYPGQNSLDYQRVDYTVAVDFDITEDVSIYFRTATGYRAGGSGERTLDFSLTFNEEDNTNYELGLKSEWLNRRLRVNADLFMTTYNDLIVLFPGPPPTYSTFLEIFNAGEAEVNGFELDLVALLGDATTVTFNYTKLDTQLKDIIVPEASFLLSGLDGATDLRGQDVSDLTDLPFAPDSAYSLSLDHSISISGGKSLDLNLNYVWRDEIYSSAIGEPQVDAFGQLSGRAALTNLQLAGLPVTISVWGKNLTDEEEATYTIANVGYHYATPRTYGLDLKVEF